MSSSSSSSSSSLSSNNASSTNNSDSSSSTRRRVKLYALNADRQWDDRGTGHVSSQFVDRLKGMALMVKAESDGSLLLESKILADTAYQKQQETLIVWSEGDNYDLALSFQEKVGCDEIWAKICAVQGKDPSVDITQDITDDDDDRFDADNDSGSGVGSSGNSGSGVGGSSGGAAFSVELPEPISADRLDELSELVSACLPFPIKREKLALALETDNYIKKLLHVFRDSERACDRKALHKLHEIFKNIFLLNKNPLFEVMLSDDALWDVIGVFEYDPNNQSSNHKNHREYLRSVSKFKEVIPLGNQELIQKIHQTYRVQYIQDVVLPTPSVFEENMLSTLSSFIFFNKVEIVSLIQEDDKFLKELFQQLCSMNTSLDKRRDLVLFLKEFSTFSQTLQPQNRENFFKTLSQLNILSTLEGILTVDDIVIKLASVDILTYVVEYSPSMVREYALQQEQTQDQDQYLVNIIIEQMICDSDPDLGMATQLSGIIKLLVDPENMLSASVVNKSEKTDFLNYFYKHCMHVLIGPVLSIEDEDDIIKRISGQSAQLLAIIVELLSFCVEHHAYHIRNYILHRDLLRKILHLMQSSHTFLVLSSLRFMRKIVGLKDEFYNRHIISGNLMLPIVEAFNANNGRYNLLDSAIIELFEFIRTEEVKSLCLYVMDKFWKQFDKVDYVRTFKGLRLQYEQHQDRLKDKSLDSPSALLSRRFRREPRQMDSDEEMWFASQDDEECDDCDQNDQLSYKLDQEFDQQFQKKMLSHVTAQQQQQQNKSLNIESKNKSIFDSLQQNDNKSEMKTQTQQQDNSSLTSTQTTTTTTTMTSRKGLVDYDIHPDEDSDEEEDGESGEEDNVVVVDSECSPSSAKRQRLQHNSS